MGGIIGVTRCTQRRFVDHPGLDIVRMGVRAYDPHLGRFLSQDPIAGGSANDYDYVNGDPINNLDLGGTCSTRHRGFGGWARSRWCNTRNAAKRAGSAAVAAGSLSGRCARYFEACVTNIKLAMSPLVVIGLTTTVVTGLVGACATVLGCLVAAPLLGTATVAGAYVSYRLAQDVWFSNRSYQRLGE